MTILTSKANRKFGIEIEAFGVDKHQLADALNQANIPCFVESYNHLTKSHWKIVTDGSIRTDGSGNAFELVSPPLITDSDLRQVQRVFDILKEKGAKVNSSCGLHVHVDARDIMDLPFLQILFLRYSMWEPLTDLYFQTNRRLNRNRFTKSIIQTSTYPSLMSRGNYPFAKPKNRILNSNQKMNEFFWLKKLDLLTGSHLQYSDESHQRNSFRLNFQDCFENFKTSVVSGRFGTNSLSSFVGSHSNFLTQILSRGFSDRYKKLNLCSFAQHGTVEFRQLEGTLDSDKVLNWIEFCRTFVVVSKMLSNEYIQAGGSVLDTPSRYHYFLETFNIHPWSFGKKENEAFMLNVIKRTRAKGSKEIIQNYLISKEIFGNITNSMFKTYSIRINEKYPNIESLAANGKMVYSPAITNPNTTIEYYSPYPEETIISSPF